MRGLPNLLTLWRRPRPPVASTPHEVVHEENKWRLLRYRPRPQGVQHATPVLLVPSLINRHYVLDLLPGKSLVEFLVAEGFDVSVVDWGTPGPEDRLVSFDAIAGTAMRRVLRRVGRDAPGGKTHLLGYCMGGTLAAIGAALEPHRVASFVALAAPVKFSEGGLLATWTRSPGFDVDALVEGTGNVPWQLTQGSFQLLRPTLPLSKLVTLLDRAWNDEFLDSFLAMETWLNDNVSIPGEFYRKYIRELYREDRLIAGTLRIAGRPVSLSSIVSPTLVVTFDQDHIVPPPSASPLVDAVGAADARHLALAGGHVGAVVSRHAARTLWPRLSQFFATHEVAPERQPLEEGRPAAPGTSRGPRARSRTKA